MQRFVGLVKKFVRDEQGLETVEYAVVGGLILATTVAMILTLGQSVLARFTGMNDAVAGTGGAAGG